MPHPLIDVGEVEVTPHAYLRRIGDVFARFDERSQDSGNVSYGVVVQGSRYFVKTAGSPDDSRPQLDHRERVALLRNAADVARSCTHPALVSLRAVVGSLHGPMLVYDWVDGELLRATSAHRDDPASAFQRFRALPVVERVAALDTVFDAHLVLVEAGWVANDLYDGSLVYDFDRWRLHLVDLDSYHRGSFVNEVGRLFGSTRFMAPEEFERGALIDERTTVFNLGRTAAVLLSDGTLEREPFRGSDAQYEAVRRACWPGPADRHPSVSAFVEAWRAGR